MAGRDYTTSSMSTASGSRPLPLPQLQPRHQQRRRADHPVQRMKGQIPPDAHDVLEQLADLAAEPGSGDGGGGAAGLDGEAADGEGETVFGEVETGASGDVDQVVALRDGSQEAGDRDFWIGLEVEVRRTGGREVAPAGAAGAAGGRSGGGLGLPPGKERLAEEALVDQENLARRHPLSVHRRFESSSGETAVVDQGQVRAADAAAVVAQAAHRGGGLGAYEQRQERAEEMRGDRRREEHLAGVMLRRTALGEDGEAVGETAGEGGRMELAGFPRGKIKRRGDLRSPRAGGFEVEGGDAAAGTGAQAAAVGEIAFAGAVFQ